MAIRHARLLFAALAGTSLLASGTAFASGFALREGDADWMANAFAGDTAKAYNASTVFSNPAGMVRLDQNEVTSAFNYIGPTVKFSGTNTVGLTATRGGNGGNLIEDAVTPAGYGVWSYSPDLKFGFSASAPFGQRVKNPMDFVGRYQSQTSSISDLSFNIDAAYRINEHWSIGGGPVIDYFEARLTQAINTGATSALTGDPVADLHGHDTAVGFDVGFLYQINPDLRLGLNYRSSIVHAITGTQGIYVPPLITALSPRTAALLASQTSLAKTKVTLPDSANLGGYWQITPKWAALGEVAWTHWSLVDKIVVTPQQAFVQGSTITENFHDTFSVSLGTSYRVIDKLLLQGGVSWDESPVDNRNRTSRIPDSDRYIIGVGATYTIAPSVDVTAAYAHIFFAGGTVNNSAQPAAGTLVGKYSSDANTFAVGATVKF